MSVHQRSSYLSSLSDRLWWKNSPLKVVARVPAVGMQYLAPKAQWQSLYSPIN